MSNLFNHIPEGNQHYYSVQILIAEAEPISHELVKQNKLSLKRVIRSSDFMSEGILPADAKRHISREVNFNNE